jgi:ABC-type glycerol-3-phosphate transport system substrate-binding protein
MKNNSQLVQTGVLIFFGVGIILGILFFSGKVKLPWDKPKAADGPTGSVVVWGVLPYSTMGGIFDAMELKYKDLTLTYVEKKPEAIQSELVNALASGKGPDVFMMRSDQVLENIDRLYVTPFSTYPDTVFKRTFADAGEILLTDTGILGFPLFMNPLIMYYNRDLFTSEFLVAPPVTWDELNELVPTLTKRDDAGKITQSAVALGATNNITHPKDLVLLRMFQEGITPIVFSKDQQKWESRVNDKNALFTSMDWYTDFVRSSSARYAWNTSLIRDKDMFISGNLAMYFGYPEDIADIRKRNPNLDFQIAPIPQKSPEARKTNYAEIYSLGISKISKNVSGSFGVINELTSKEKMSLIIAGTYYAPTRKDMLGDKSRDNSELALIYNSSIISKAFLDPDATRTTNSIITSIGQINSGAKTVDQTTNTIGSVLNDILSKITAPKP